VKKGVLKLERRRKIYNFILRHPGLHLSELSRKLNIPKTTMNYHLKYIEKQSLVTTKSEGRYTRYYVANKLNEIDKKILNLIRQGIPCEIIIYLFSNPDSSRMKISKHLNKHPTTISFHLNKLMDRDIIENFPVGNEARYRIKNSEDVFDLLIRYGRNFFDDTVD